jgi:hypothetical protein
VDEASVHATLLRDAAASPWQRLRAFLRFHKAVL